LVVSCSGNPCVSVGEFQTFHVKKSFGGRAMLETTQGVYPVSDIAWFPKKEDIYLRWSGSSNIYCLCKVERSK